jgi:hypothetical protein
VLHGLKKLDDCIPETDDSLHLLKALTVSAAILPAVQAV